jgi:hypothetical protein
LNLQSEKQPLKACRVIIEQVQLLKLNTSYLRNQAILKRIENDFGGEIVLAQADTTRTLVYQGKLTKIGQSGKIQPYFFMLFSDLLLYASEGINSKYKCHRVIHLSLCRLEDIRSNHAPQFAFRIISPQKSFAVAAANKNEKAKWLEVILININTIMAKRKLYLNKQVKEGNKDEASKANVLSSANSLAVSDDNLLRRYSTFIGQSELNLTAAVLSDSTLNSPSTAVRENKVSELNHCKLCIRAFTLFRRRQRCKYCNDAVCSDCHTRKANLGKRLEIVCDACYGVLKGMIGAELPPLTIITAETP